MFGVTEVAERESFRILARILLENIPQRPPTNSRVETPKNYLEL
jgi:hypothetical protein